MLLPPLQQLSLQEMQIFDELSIFTLEVILHAFLGDNCEMEKFGKNAYTSFVR